MAKRKPILTLEEMERELGYKVDSVTYPVEGVERFYSDFRPVRVCAYEKTKKEFEEHEKKKHCKVYEPISMNILPKFGVSQVIMPLMWLSWSSHNFKTIQHGQDTITLTNRSHVGFYRFALDIYYGFGFDLPLLLTEDEAFRTISVAKVSKPGTLLKD